MTAETTAETAYAKLVALLDGGGARYELIDHPPEGRTDLVSPLRGNELSQAAKCIVVMVKLGKKAKRHVLAVVPGDARVDLNALKRLLGGTYAAFASPDVAERLAGSAGGAGRVRRHDGIESAKAGHRSLRWLHGMLAYHEADYREAARRPRRSPASRGRPAQDDHLRTDPR